MSSQFSLLTARRFGPFFWTQFLGAFNDNLYKNALVVLLTFHTAQWTTLRPEMLANLAAGIFMLPFFLFSATAGQLADKYDKAMLTRLVKLLEIVIMVLVGVGFWIHSLQLLLFSLFLLGLQSTLFGPVKYAILPQHLRHDELVGGNALVEAGTFVAILLGTLSGGLLAAASGGAIWIVVAGLTVSVVGYMACRGIPAAQAPEPELRINLNPITETWRNISFARSNHTAFLAILGISWFWLFGALMLAQFPAFVKNVLGGDEEGVTLLLGVFTLGIGLGSLLCERLSAGQVEIGLVPLGSIGLTIFALDLAFAAPAVPSPQPLQILALLALPSTWHVLADLLAIGIFGGFFIVPLYALMQIHSQASHRARIVAANNIINALFMVIGAVAAAGLLAFKLSIPALFGIAALCNAIVAIYICRLVPEFILRFAVWMLVHSFYRLRKKHLNRIPAEGPALLVCNHLSYVDALIVAASCSRPIRFVINRRFFDLPALSFLLRQGRAIALTATASGISDPQPDKDCLASIQAALAAGELVAVFPENGESFGQEASKFSPWLDRLLDVISVPVIPLALSGLRDSLFAIRRSEGHQPTRKWRLLHKVTVAVGEPQIAGDVNAGILADAIRVLQ